MAFSGRAITPKINTRVTPQGNAQKRIGGSYSEGMPVGNRKSKASHKKFKRGR